MARARFCKVCGGWHKLDEWPLECMPSVVEARSNLPAPLLKLDTMEPVKSMLDGKMYDSKAALRATYKAAGVTEIGDQDHHLKKMNAEAKAAQKAKRREEIRDAVGQSFARMGMTD